MNSLSLSLLPSLRTHDDSGSLQIEQEGFVDEDAVLALIRGPKSTRSTSYPADLALTANDLDFAGWQLPAAQAPVSSLPHNAEASVRRATPPQIFAEPGIGDPHRGAHRWWLAGLAGAFSTMLFALLLVSLSSRFPVPEETAPLPRFAIQPPPAGAPEAGAFETPPELTDASTHRR